MNSIYENLKLNLERKLAIRSDKPEETVESTLNALWLKVHGQPVSAEKSLTLPLPELNQEQTYQLEKLIEQRLSGQPLAYLTGRQSFMDVELICDSRALIPRKETEILGNKALEICQQIAEKKNEVKIMDVCCGSGNLGLALASKIEKVSVWASDLSEEAVALTNENIDFLNIGDRVKVIQSDLFQNFETEEFLHKIDLIVCNPPYISTSKVQKMDSEISENEPILAFDGGMIGLKVIQRFIREAPGFLVKGGWIAFEVGLGQGPFITQLCEKSGFYYQIESVCDQGGNIRVIAAQC